MPKFAITTVEKWQHKVTYHIESETIAEAYAKIEGMEAEYSGHEVIEGGDEVLFIDSIETGSLDEESIEVPPEYTDRMIDIWITWRDSFRTWKEHAQFATQAEADAFLEGIELGCEWGDHWEQHDTEEDADNECAAANDDEVDDDGDDLCDMCNSSGVSVERTTYCGKTIGIGCGCEATCDGTCGRDGCEACEKGSAASAE